MSSGVATWKALSIPDVTGIQGNTASHVDGMRRSMQLQRSPEEKRCIHDRLDVNVGSANKQLVCSVFLHSDDGVGET